MKISVNLNLEKIAQGLEGLSKSQASFAVAAALTDTAKDVTASETHEIDDSFDRPKPITRNSLKFRPATKANLEAVVSIKNYMGKGNSAEEYLAAEIEGGQRLHKRFEMALIRAGIMAPGYYAVPGAGAELDQYGNISRGLIVQLLSYFQAFPEQGALQNMSSKRKAALAKGRRDRRGVAYFVSFGDKWLRRGIWARYSFGHGSSVKPILMFVRGANYEKRFDYFYAAEKTVERQFPVRFKARWEQAWTDAWVRANR